MVATAAGKEAEPVRLDFLPVGQGGFVDVEHQRGLRDARRLGPEPRGDLVVDSGEVSQVGAIVIGGRLQFEPADVRGLGPACRRGRDHRPCRICVSSLDAEQARDEKRRESAFHRCAAHWVRGGV